MTSLSIMFAARSTRRLSTCSNQCRFIRSFSTSQLNTKQHFNIGTIGDESHGKTTLGRAILNTLDRSEHLHQSRENFNELNQDKMSQLGQSRTVNLEFETVKRHYLLADNSGNPDHVTNMIVGCSGPAGSGPLYECLATDSFIGEMHSLSWICF